jgi:hypothetical protein
MWVWRQAWYRAGMHDEDQLKLVGEEGQEREREEENRGGKGTFSMALVNLLVEV